jgi:hypothetical protein
MTRSPFRSLLLASLSIIAAVMTAGAFASCRKADASENDGNVGVEVYRFSVDSARAIAKWSKVCDAKGCPDSFGVRWTVGAQVTNKTTTNTADTIRFPYPAIGDSLFVSVGVTSIRRGKASSVKTAGNWLLNADAPPPPVDSIKIDTLPSAARVDSQRTDFYTLAGRLLGSSHDAAPVTIAEHDTVRAVTRLFFKANQARRVTDTIAWTTNPGTSLASMRVTPIGPGWHADTAVIIALDCGCRGTPGSPPQLDVRSGRYLRRTALGTWQPVTPLAADPFRDAVRETRAGAQP